jgi:pseudouridine-5'-phosphate glycosidase
LETHGVPVVGFETDVLPAFYTRTSPFNVNYRVDIAEEASEMIRTKWELGLKGGVVIANPIPEQDALEEAFITGVIETALQEAKDNGMSGKKVTPFLLGKVKELTEGISLTANIALVKHNAEVGSKIAISLNNKKKGSQALSANDGLGFLI